MDARDRMESYTKWKSDEAKIMVATKAFGMGINKHNIRHAIYNGVPESIVGWAQELGRAGRGGKRATATIMYRKSDICHADAWIWNNLGNKDRCQRVLGDYAASWRFVQAHLSGTCRRKVLLWLFGDDGKNSRYDSTCCDVSTKKDSEQLVNYKNELRVLFDALQNVGSKGEVKIAEWIRGSAITWTDKYNKQCYSYSNHCGHDIMVLEKLYETMPCTWISKI